MFICSSCGKKVPIDTTEYRCSCGGLYDLDFFVPKFSLNLIDKTQFNIFRYRAFMPLQNNLWKNVTLGEGMTDTIQFDKNLYLKLDYAMPTLSFKDRGAALLIWLCKTLDIKNVVQDSSGNAGNSIAAYCARTSINCEIFVPAGTSQKKIHMISSHGAKVTIYNGSRDETASACREKSLKYGVYYANHVYNPFFYQGTKTYIYEVFEQLNRIPDNLFIPVGNGTLLLGCEYALKELFIAGLISKLPKIFIVQSDRCAPLYQAKGVPRDIVPQETIAEGIAVGKPMRGISILNSDYKGEREVLLVKEESILPAREQLALKGFFVEHTAAATYAAYLECKKEERLLGDTLIPLCGAGLKSEK